MPGRPTYGVRPPRKRRFRMLLILLAVATAVAFFIWSTIPSPKEASKGSPSSTEVSTFNKKQLSTDDPASIWVVVNKKRPLNPADYAPDLGVPSMPLRLGAGNEEMQLSTAIIPSLLTMVEAAKKDGVNFMLASGYRSYNFQKNLYASYVKKSGQAEADKTSARAGHSEHQTGLAADLEPTSRQCEIDTCFGELPEGRWLAANAWRYGFIIRYQQSTEAITGYEYEPWHIRYVGSDLAAEMHNQNIATLEEFFGLPGGPDY